MRPAVSGLRRGKIGGERPAGMASSRPEQRLNTPIDSPNDLSPSQGHAKSSCAIRRAATIPPLVPPSQAVIGHHFTRCGAGASAFSLPVMVFLQVQRQAKAEKGEKSDEADGFHWCSSERVRGFDERNSRQPTIKAVEKGNCPP